jgi:hypothetical protein
MSATDDARVIGYFAYTPPNRVVCDGDACVIAGSAAALRTYISELDPSGGARPVLKKTRFGEIMDGMMLGGPYAFDETAYNRFYPLARRAGYDVGPEDFTATGPGRGQHLVRVQWMARR